MTDRIEIQIPFQGFYNSFYSELLDREEESFIEDQKEKGLDDDAIEELEEILWLTSSYHESFVEMSRLYINSFNEKFKEWSDVDLRLTFVAMESPKEYNFVTDRLFANADTTAICKLRGMVDEEVLQKHMIERHRSRSGFISFYSYKLGDWPERVEHWDHNQIQTLIECFLPENWEWDVYQDISEYKEPYRAWEAGVNWEQVNKFLEQFENTENEVE